MRVKGVNIRFLFVSGRGLNRLSTSCPSLNVDGEEIEEDDSPTCSEEFLDARKNRGGNNDCHRRRSWSGLSDEEKKRARHRRFGSDLSISLSSLDSDAEEAFYDAEDSTNTQGSDSVDGSCRRGVEKQRSMSGSSSPVTYGGGGSSTHSLNDVHLQEKRSSGPIEKPRLLAPRLTLQKSISTPSILAGVATQPPQQPPQSNYQYEDDAESRKRRKRGSIFFRKRKDKDKFKKSSHHFVAVCYSNSATCDVCSKPMTNKPALRCETCQVCVHENSCKDQISDCSKLKNPKHIQLAAGLTTLVIQKPGGTVGLSTNTKSASLGSYAVGGTGVAPGATKSQTAAVARSRSAAAHSSSPTRPTSVSSPSGCVSSPVRRLSGFSQWKRVATKLGVNKVQSEEKEGELLTHDIPDANILEVNSASMESLDDGGNEEPPIDYIDADPELKLLDKEPELWVHTVDKEVVAGLSEKQIKKQEHIYELIITEKHHCRMLKVMQKVFADGMARELHMQENRIKRIFPCLDDLINIHCSFLWRLRQRQRTGKYIDKIGDLLVEQFVGDNAQGLKDAYGQFCSQHQDAVSYYKDILKTDRRFQAFIRQKSLHPLMKKKGIPECILFVTHRVTKYPLILEALMKYSKDQEEELISLKHALDLVKEILVNINAQVAEKDREQRLLEVYHKIDAKSSAVYREQKFKKSDLLSSRKLKFEGSAMLTQQKGKPIMVQVIVLSDLIFFLLENNQKYYFFSPDTKQADVIPLEKLIVREKAGEGSRAIYLIYSKNAAEMFELECIHPKDKKIWLESIREAIDQCPEEDNTGEASGEISKLLEANSEKIRHITGILQHKDKELARLCEDKMNLVIELLELLGHDDFPPTPQYRALLDEHQLDYNTARDLQINSLNEALRLVSGACGWGTNLARSVSSVGEHQSDAYVSPSLPKRAETFGGFDNPNKDASGHASKQSGGKKKKDSRLSLTSTGTTDSDVMESLKNRRPSGSTLAVRSSQDNLSIGSTMSDSVTQQQQQALAAKLIYWLQTSLVLSQHHLTQFDILRTKMVVGGSSVDGRFRHSQKLEELRNIQEQISHERAQWNKERDAQEKWISEKKLELQKKQEDLRMNEQDITQQRELLYRKLEALKAQGIILSPTLTVLTTAPPSHSVHDEHHIGNVIAGAGDGGQSSQGSPHSSPPSAAPARMRTDPKHRNSTAGVASLIKRDSNQSLPTHLISAANQQKAAISVKQQLPMKLAKLGSSSSTGSSSGSGGGGASSPSQDRIEHHRTHVSPGASGVVQMLPLKLSQGPDEKKGSRMTVGYQRLASPPPSLHEPPPGPSHQRTGSSPATLQNGSPITSPGASTPTATTTAQGAHATRTNTYPKLPSKPSAMPTPRATTTPEALQEGSGVGSAARPGHRIKDPVTNQDIIFF
ncbi:rho guanine nucleotide exchange factor 18-like isoform X9 [Macrobrachium nipponense]|uniref:rho guanine nucleotide exchange factor 18-like isoform X9 n=1 Tax=Macrobrachium nipponense TaxID=159736 RepID=UPI0030C8A671